MAETIATHETVGTISDGAHNGGGLNGQDAYTGRILPVAFSSKDYGGDAETDLSPTLRAGGHDGSHANAGVPPAVAIQERAISENPDAGPDGSGVRDDGAAYTLEARQTPQAVAFKPSHYTRGKDGAPSEVFPPLSADADKGDQDPVIAYGFEDRARGDDGRGYDRAPHFTEGVAPTAGTVKPPAVATSWAVRRLTPTETLRLQGFPDGYTQIPWRGKPAELCPDGPQYKSHGNSMAVPVMRWLGTRIEMIETLMKELKDAG